MRAGTAWSASVDERGEVVLRDGSGTERYRITAPLAWDSAADPSVSNALQLSVDKVSDGRWTVTLRPDAAWLSDPARVYPVSIDPDFSWSNGTTHFHGATDCYLSGNTQANNTFCAQTYLQTGYFNRPYKSIFKFDIASAIPSNATVSAATFKAYAPPASARASGNHRLHTITSDWDSTATWNNRKTGVPWTTAGGDISTNASYSSSSPTAVQALSTWFTFPAPLATVQGWVAGTLPNYGFMLATDAGAPANQAYAWASSEASTSSSFPATSNEWPTLDVTWTAPTADVTAPTAPTDLEVGAVDDQDATTFLSFVPGLDAANGSVPASGVADSQYRYKLDGGAFTNWQTAQSGGVSEAIFGVVDGSEVVAETRTRDVAGNVSQTTSLSVTVHAPDPDTRVQQDNVGDWYADKYNVSQSVADAWVDSQHLTNVLNEEILASSASSEYAGFWFTNDDRVAHVGITSESVRQTVNALVAQYNLTSVVQVDLVTWKESALSAAAISAQETLSALISAGRVQVGSDVSHQRVVFTTPNNLTSSEQAQIASARTATGVPTTLVQEAGSTVADVPTACTTKPLASASVSGTQALYCSGPQRGGVVTQALDLGSSPLECTMGFNAIDDETGAELMVQAAHCSGNDDSRTTKAIYSPRVSDQTGLLKRIQIGFVLSAKYKFDADGKGIDAEAIFINSNSFKGKNFRPWVIVLATPASVEPQVPVTTRNPQYEISRVDSPGIGTLVCTTGSISRRTNCGYVDLRDLRRGNAARIGQTACVVQGDSGGPVYSRGTAYGIVVAKRPNSACGVVFQGARTLENALHVQILTVDRATQKGTTYSATIGSCRGNDQIWIRGQGCLFNV